MQQYLSFPCPLADTAHRIDANAGGGCWPGPPSGKPLVGSLIASKKMPVIGSGEYDVRVMV
jgi:hypothetical protein